MTRFYIKIITIAFVAFSFGCDTIEGPYVEDPDGLRSTVTLFEFTGIGCVYCPEKGHEVIANYQKIFGDKLQVISVHGREFGDPIDGFVLLTKEGNQLTKELEVEGLPKGVVGSLNTGEADVPESLGDEIVEQGFRYSELELNVEMVVVDSVATVKINGIFAASLVNNYSNLNICVYLMQSHIVGPQKDIRGDHEEYIHKHALRKPFTDLLGELYVNNPNGGMVVEEKTFVLNLNEANIVLEANETFADAELEPFVFVYDADTKYAIPFEIKF